MTFWTKWLRLQRSQWLNQKSLEHLQLKALRKLLEHAYRTVPFYHKLYDSVSADPLNIRSLDDLARLPTVSKEKLRASSVEERLSSEFSAAECYTRRTSGSTGQPLQILRKMRPWSTCERISFAEYSRMVSIHGRELSCLTREGWTCPQRARVFEIQSPEFFPQAEVSIMFRCGPLASSLMLFDN